MDFNDWFDLPQDIPVTGSLVRHVAKAAWDHQQAEIDRVTALCRMSLRMQADTVARLRGLLESFPGADSEGLEAWRARVAEALVALLPTAGTSN